MSIVLSFGIKRIINPCIKKLLLFIIIGFALVKTNAQSVGGTTLGSDTVCNFMSSGFITLSGHVGTIIGWESSINNGANWATTGNLTTAQSYNALLQTTQFRAIVQDGAFPPDTSTISTITVNPPAIGGTLSGGGTFCDNSGPGTLTLSGQLSTVVNWLISTNNGVSWTTINNTTTTLNHPSITENTLYAAVVVNISGCPLDTSTFASFVIDPNTNTGSYLEKDTTLCSGVNSDTIDLVGRTGDVLDWELSIDNGANWTSLGNTTDTVSYNGLTATVLYRTIVQSGVCNSDTTNPIVLTVVDPNPVDAGDDQDITQFETVQLNGIGVGSPSWSPTSGLDNPTVLNPSAKPEFTTTYIITLTDSNFCVSSDTVNINVTVPIPNAITPNGDGANDFFIINNIESSPNSSLDIYNKYGNIVFDQSPYMNNWDGTSSGGADLPDGIYYYSLDFGDGRKVKTGYVLIKR